MAEKILVVDDDLDTLRLVGMMLERQGYQILAATSGQQALGLARSDKPDLVILDLMMPDMDGLEVARQLRSSPDTKDISIIMFTAKGQTDDKLEGFDAGADDYLTKPTQPRELVAHVRAVLKRSERLPGSSGRQYTEQGQLIGVIAAKGGVGVSTVAVNLGIALQQQSKKKVVVTDFRPGCGTIGLELGYKNPGGMSGILDANPKSITPQLIEDGLINHASGVRFLLSTARPQDASLCNAIESFEMIAQQIAYLGQYIVLDLGGSLTPVNQKVLEQCSRIILTMEPVGQTVQQTRDMLEYLSSKGIAQGKFITVLVNRLRAGIQLSLGQVQDAYGRNIDVIFTAAPDLAYQSQESTVPMILRQADGVTTQQFNSLADTILKRSR
jgi:DNA-binding response OmpR family regulator